MTGCITRKVVVDVVDVDVNEEDFEVDEEDDDDDDGGGGGGSSHTIPSHLHRGHGRSSAQATCCC